MATTLDDLLPLLAQLSNARAQRHSLAELAERAGTSPSQFHRAFARAVGQSPKQHTRRLQLECAAALLLTTSDSVLDIALRVGFHSHEGFTRAFAGQFGRPPVSFRARGLDASGADRARHANLIAQVGPCLRLFRARTSTATPTGDCSMSYDITTQHMAATTLLTGTARCAHGAIAETLGRILPAVFQHVTSEGIAMLGPPTTLYTEWGPGMVTLRAGMPVPSGTAGTAELEAVELAAGDAAVTLHTGPYDGLGDAHAAVEVYLADNGLTRRGPIREIYLTDPGEVPDPVNWQTQVVWPVSA